MSLIAHWKLDDCDSNTDVVDAVAAANGVASVNTDTVGFSVAGKRGNGLYFAGTRNINLNAFASNGQTYSFAFWLKMQAATDQRFFDSLASGGHRLLLRHSDASNFGLQFYDGAWKTSSHTLSTGTWYHIVYKLDATEGEADILVDGVSVATPAYTGRNIGDTVRMASTYNDTGKANCTLDGFRIYNHLLSASEIAALMGAARPLVGGALAGGHGGLAG